MTQASFQHQNINQEQHLRTMLNIIFLFSNASRKSLCNAEVVLGKYKYQNTRKTFSAGTHKLETIKNSSSSSSNKNRECLSSMLPEAF